MFNKTFLLNKIINSLQKNKFEVFVTHGCFDIAAKKEDLILIKTLFNIDALDKNQALSLRTIAHFVSAYPFVISLKNNREFLDNQTIYSRFELPILTPKLFENMITEEISAIQSAKGKHTVEINTLTLKERRKELDYTLDELSSLIGISKKALYEIENNRVTPQERTVNILEKTLRIELKTPYHFKNISGTHLEPRNEFQAKVSKELNRIGIDNSSVYSTSFEIIGRDKFSLITRSYQNTTKIKRDLEPIKKLSNIFSSFAMFITKKSNKKTIEGIPIILESELPNVSSSNELNKLIQEKSD